MGRTIHVGLPGGSYAAVDITDEAANKLIAAGLLYECGDDPGDHDLHINPTWDKFSNIEALIYRILDDERDKSGGAPGGAGNDPGGCGQVLPAAGDGDEGGLEEARVRTEIQVRQAVGIAKATNAGSLPAEIQRLVDKILLPKVDWRAVLRRFIDESLSRDYAWSRPNKRLLPHGLILPSLISDGLNHLVIAVDTSGSIDAKTLDAFAAEINGAFGDGNIDHLTVIYADAAVKRVETYEVGDELTLRPAGGGGTAFSSTFQWIAQNVDTASAIIYLTDLQVSDFGEEPAAPVLWAVWGDRRTFPQLADRAPFGEPIHIAA